MGSWYASPIRVYLLLGALAVAGIWSGFRLPVSLFPNSTKPNVFIEIPYGSITGSEFLDAYGRQFEDQLRALRTEEIEVEKLKANYWRRNVGYNVVFKWGTSPLVAQREVQNVANAFAARLPLESREGMRVEIWNENTGFFAASYFSEKRSLDELYDLLEPLLTPKIKKIQDAGDSELWNPSKKEIRIELNPESLASLQLLPREVEPAVLSMLQSLAGGSVTVGEKTFFVEMPPRAAKPEELGKTPVITSKGRVVPLGDIAKIDLTLSSQNNRSFKTDGADSLILFATPRPGGNVKRMSEEMIKAVEELRPSLPSDVKVKILVDPSEFIRDSIFNVLKEVGLAALLAVSVLFLFIGSFRNVFTAAIEIPLSMVLAFILMRITKMNLNLISLGGLALSAGMNVDASVVVMENIFRHFEKHRGVLDAKQRLQIVIEAVKEVRFPILASTVASLVVFLPLAFTSDLSYALLGDLAWAVVFSHGFSAFVALLLVPTVRLQLMQSGSSHEAHSPIDGPLKKLEQGYCWLLGKFLAVRTLRWSVFGGCLGALALAAIFILPNLPREIVAKPDTDWVYLDVNTEGNTLIRQMEGTIAEVERGLLGQLGSKVDYMFTQVWNTNGGGVMARLKHKRDMKAAVDQLEKYYQNSPSIRYHVGSWNPSELPIPTMPDLKLAIRGGDPKEREAVARDISDLFQEKKLYPRVDANPNLPTFRGGIQITPYPDLWGELGRSSRALVPSDLLDYLRVATDGKRIAYYPGKHQRIPVVFAFPHNLVSSIEAVGELPIGLGGKIIPIKALGEVTSSDPPPALYREDGKELIYINGDLNTADKPQREQKLASAKKLVADWESKHKQEAQGPRVMFEAGDQELRDAIQQLSIAVGLSVALIFMVMVLQFGSLVEPILVLISIPLGFLGVLLSLFIFGSTMSLNSALGVILLNGIAVANSILLVDFIKRGVADGMEPREAALEAAKARLRPILITSLTTILGMLPMALGFGDGGKILQPLGIAVSGGMWVSTLFTLLLVPSLQVAYLEMRGRERRPRRKWFGAKEVSDPVLITPEPTL